MASDDPEVCWQIIRRLDLAGIRRLELVNLLLPTLAWPSVSRAWRRVAYMNMAASALGKRGEAIAERWIAEFPTDYQAHFYRSLALKCERFESVRALGALRRAYDLAVVAGDEQGVSPPDRLHMACFLATEAAQLGRDDWVEEAAEAIVQLDETACHRAFVDVLATARIVACRPIDSRTQSALTAWCERAHASRRAHLGDRYAEFEHFLDH